MEKLEGNIVDIHREEIYPGIVYIHKGKIAKIEPSQHITTDHYILPGFIDAHIHIESSMLVPSEFARIAVKHGTVGTVSDPHEIANVCGLEGVQFMIDNGNSVPFHFNFGAPSCVPATEFETAGATLGIEELEELLKRPEVKYLSEMMNWPGVLQRDSLVMDKIKLAQKYQKPVDGHAPGLKGQQAYGYIAAGISTDHECFSREEAEDKLKSGMKILIREGSAAKNYEALHTLIEHHYDQMMFCSDDKHPDELMNGHINLLVQRSLQLGYPLFKVLKMACLNPILHYSLDIGTLRENDSADFIVMDDIQSGSVLSTYIKGEADYKNNQSFTQRPSVTPINQFNANPIKAGELTCPMGKGKLKVIQVQDGELITKSGYYSPRLDQKFMTADVNMDILKLVVLERYSGSNQKSIAWINGFGIKKGAIASTVAHDSHNIVACGTSDESIAQVINKLIEIKGGIALTDDDEVYAMPLSVGGLMSTGQAEEVAHQYETLDLKAKSLGSKLSAPFMSLSFMALLVIPELKLSDQGLFDASKFQFCNIFDGESIK